MWRKQKFFFRQAEAVDVVWWLGESGGWQAESVQVRPFSLNAQLLRCQHLVVHVLPLGQAALKQF